MGNQHSSSINRKRKNICRADFLVISESIRCKKTTEIIDEIYNTVTQWKWYVDELEVMPLLRNEIEKSMYNFYKSNHFEKSGALL